MSSRGCESGSYRKVRVATGCCRSFPMKSDSSPGFPRSAESYPGTFVVSRNALSRALSRSVSSEIVYLAAIAALLIPLLACLLLRDVRLTALALVPVVTGITAVLGMIPVLGLSLTAPSVISAMVVVGPLHRLRDLRGLCLPP